MEKIRLLTYNTHLMKDSIIVKSPLPHTPLLFEDDTRRGEIIHAIKKTEAHIVALQEVWAVSWQNWFREQLQREYPYCYLGAEGGIIEASAGLILLSKFPLKDYYFEKFKGMSGEDSWSSKGVLCATVELPEKKDLRIGITHASCDTGGIYCNDLRILTERTVNMRPEFKEMPAVLMGDFNVHANKYPEMKNIMSAVQATDSWNDVHGDKDTAGSYTIDMRNNTLDQFFSPERDTAGPSRIDYAWTRGGKNTKIKPVNAIVQRNWVYDSMRWYWAHKITTKHSPSVAELGGKICVVTQDYGNGRSGGVMAATYNKKEKTWTHYHIGGVNTSAAPGIIAYNNRFYVFFRDPGGNGVFRIHSDDGLSWHIDGNIYQGFDSGGALCPVLYDNKVYLFHVDSDGEGGKIRFRTWDGKSWSNQTYIDITTRHNISAAVLNGKLAVISRDNGSGSTGGVMMALLDKPGGKWECYQAGGKITSGAPAIVAFDNKFHIFYRDPGGNAIFRMWSADGKRWEQSGNPNTCHDTQDCIGASVHDGKIHLYFPYPNGEHYMPHVMAHTELANTRVDFSDHYPYVVDIEIS